MLTRAKMPKLASYSRENATESKFRLDMTLELKSQGKGQDRYGLEIFREDVKLF